MKSVIIYYFSGTGNTKRVSEMVRAQFKARDVNVNLIPIEEQLKEVTQIDLSKYDLLGLAYPIYGLGAPSIVYDLVKLLPTGNGLKTFIFPTGADYISLNHNASTNLIKDLEKRDYSVFYNRIIVMPSNWLLEYKDTFVKQLVKCAEDKVEHMCEELLNLKERRYKTGGIIKYLSLCLAHLESRYGSKQFGRSLRANESCNLCNYCVKNCPVGNIVQKDEKLIFMNRCIFCMRCVYRCPQNAINSRGFGFTIFKDGYDIEKVLKDDTIDKDYITDKTKGFFKHFYKYINDVRI